MPIRVRSFARLGALGAAPLQWALGLALGVGLLVYVARHAVSGSGRVILHVLEPDVEVTLGPIRFEFQDRTAAPIVVDLPPGRYDFRVRRGPALLFAESFDLAGGESQVLTAVDDRNRRIVGAPLDAARPEP